MATALAMRPVIITPTELKPKVLQFPIQPGEKAGLPPECQYVLVKDRDDNIVSADIPWLESPKDGIIRNGQIWHVEDDGKHAKPFSELEQIRFMHGMKSPIIVIGWIGSMALSLFLQEILAGKATYLR